MAEKGSGRAVPSPHSSRNWYWAAFTLTDAVRIAAHITREVDADELFHALGSIGGGSV
jgi:hypothetical protein